MEWEGKMTPLFNLTYLDKVTDKVQIQRYAAVSKVPAALGICKKSLYAPIENIWNVYRESYCRTIQKFIVYSVLHSIH